MTLHLINLLLYLTAHEQVKGIGSTVEVTGEPAR